VANVAASLGKTLMPWQRYVADVAMELDADGSLYYDRVIVTVPRQSGKTTLVLPVFAHRSVAEFPGGRLDRGPQRQTIAYTAQTRNDARKKWIKEFIPLLEASPFRHQFDKRLTNGSEGLDWANGSTFDLVATMEKSGHGDTLDLGIIDEAFAQTDDRLEQALEPAMITRVSPQLWIISTAGENEVKSPFLWAQVAAGRKICAEGLDSRTAYFEWSVGDDEDADDIEVVASRHPAVGYTITVADLDARRRQFQAKGDMSGFRRAYCNMWGAVEALRDAKLPTDAWADSVTDSPPDIAPGTVTIAYDVSLDGAWGSIAVGAADLRAPYVELVEHREGSGWIPGRMVELVQAWRPLSVGCNGAGPAGAQVQAVREAFARAGIEPDLLKQMSAPEYKQACGGFYTDVVEGRLVRPGGQGPLDLAAGDASERPLGDAWAWDIRSATVPISPLVAVTIARALLPYESEEPSDPMLMLL
jgi:hypothetical protein